MSRVRTNLMTEVAETLREKLRAHLMPYQWRWLVDDSRYKLAEKARRTGWTYVEALRAVLTRLRRKRDYWFSSADESAGREFIEYCRFWCNLVGKAVAIATDEEIVDRQGGYTMYQIRLVNGSRITALSSSPKAFRGKGGDATWDEAAWHDDGAGMWAAIEAVTTWGGTLSVFGTHNGEESFFNGVVKDAVAYLSGAKAEGEVLPWSYYRTTIEDAVEAGLVEKIEGLKRKSPAARAKWLKLKRAAARTEDIWQQEWMCNPNAEASVLLSYELINACTVEPEEILGRFGGGPLYAGFDVGREKDLSVFPVAERVARILVLRHLERFEKTPYRDQKQAVLDFWSGHPIRRFCGDATGLGDNLIEDLQYKHGKYRVEKVKFTNEVKEDLAVGLLNRFEDRAIVIPRDRALRESLHKIRKTVTTAGNVRYDAARDNAGHADEFWGLALMDHAAGRRVQRIGSQPSKPKGF